MAPRLGPVPGGEGGVQQRGAERGGAEQHELGPKHSSRRLGRLRALGRRLLQLVVTDQNAHWCPSTIAASSRRLRQTGTNERRRSAAKNDTVLMTRSLRSL